MSVHYNVVVVGAGIEGSWTALQAARKLKSSSGRVLLLEQFPLPHARGSSHGQTRIIRHAYAENYHAALMPRAFSEWRLLEKETGQKLFIPTPLLCVADPSGYASLQSTLKSLRDVLPGGESGPNPLFRELSSEQLRQEFPQATFSEQHRGVLENCAGILRADKCLDAVQRQFVSLGGEIRDGVKVTSLKDSGSQVLLQVQACGQNGQNYQITADKVAVCAGPWTSKLIEPLLSAKLPLTPLRVNVYYWRIKDGGPGAIKTSYIDLGDGGEFWGIPEYEYPGMVKYLHPTHLIVDPESRDIMENQDGSLQEFLEIQNHIAKYFPGVDNSKPAIQEHCMYTMTPDHTSIIDYVCNNNKNIVYACGFSGTGFKKAPSIGLLVSEMLLDPQKCTIEPKPFSFSRFIKK